MRSFRLVSLSFLVTASCGGSSAPAPDAAADSPTDFGPLEVGAEWQSKLTRINKAPFQSPDHGGRWVNTYTNELAMQTVFAATGTFAVGSILVKESFEDDNGRPSAVPGPTFVMEKRSPGYNPDGRDWWWAIHWAEPKGRLAANVDGPIYWRGKAGKVTYCWKCHDKWSEHDGVAVGIPDDNLLRPGAPAKDSELGTDEVEEVTDF